MNRQRKIEIEKTEKYIAWTDAEGTRHEYERPITTLHLHVQELKARQSFMQLTLPGHLESGETSAKQDNEEHFSQSFIGVALLEDIGIEVIGYPTTKNRTLSIEFRMMPEGNETRSEKIQSVMLGYSSSDREIDTGHDWWISIYLPPAQFRPLAQAVETRQLSRLTLGVQLENLYVKEWYAVPSGKLSWYLPPDADSRSGSKIAYGEIHTFSFETTVLDLRPPAPQEIEAELLNSETDYKPPPQHKLVRAVETLSTRLSGIQKILLYLLGGFLILVLVIGRKL